MKYILRIVAKRRAVAPVLATLLMIAVAVAMSVLVFMWSQTFLSGTSTAAGSQQGQQNQAAQSSISIESVTGNTKASSLTIVIRNVGAISVTLGSATIQGLSSNAGFNASITCVNAATSPCSVSGSQPIIKGAAVVLTVTGVTSLISGDTLTVKVTTSVGTFASAQFTVP